MQIRVAPVSFLALLALASGCTTYHDELARGQRAFEQNDHDKTLAVLRDLEPDLRRLSPPEQAEYAYLRGMTDYRVGYRSDARHWLSMAVAMEEASPGMLPADWKDRTTEALKALNDVVYTQGTGGLTTSRAAMDDEPKGKDTKDAKDTKDVKKETRETPSGEGKRPKDADKPASSSQRPAATP